MYSILKVKKINGFTLLEMIIALSIFTFLSAIMATVLSSALSAYRAATGKNEAMLQAKTAMDWLVRDIQPPAPWNSLTEMQIPAVINLTNTTTLVWLRYYLDTDMIKRRDSVSGQSDMLAENVTYFNISYYDINNIEITTPTPANVRVIQIRINTTRNGQNFEGYTTARFQPQP